MTIYLVSVTVHVLAALLWLGGMFFLGAVGAPVLRRVEPPELRAKLFHELGVKFRWVGWVAIGVLVASGLTTLHLRGLLRWDILGDAGFWTSPYGTTLAWKLVLVAAMVTVSAVHDFWLGPRAGALDPSSEEARRFRRWAAWLARVNALLGVALVWVAVRLARGG